jgi:N-acetylmuramoyl-L-alanine amidase
MATIHRVQQGEHISSIAEHYGFLDWRIIWDDAQNDAMRARRNDPDVLYPGDEIVIPDKQIKTEYVVTGKIHVFRITAPPLQLRICIQDFDNKPMPGLPCEVEIDGAPQQVATDEKGFLNFHIPRTAKEGRLRIEAIGVDVPLKIGHMDPAEEDSGWVARLINLGYFGGAVGDMTDALLPVALEEFQCDHGLKVTGLLDEATRSKLREVHGS